MEIGVYIDDIYVHVNMKKQPASNMRFFFLWPNFGPTKLQQVSSLAQRRVANAVRHGPGTSTGGDWMFDV